MKRGSAISIGGLLRDDALHGLSVQFADGSEAETSLWEASGTHNFVAVSLRNAAEGDDSRRS